MADVYGRLTGRAAVAMATLGPGATNLLTGIADAYLDRAPIVAITGQASSDKLHKEAHQVVDVVDMFRPVTKWNARDRANLRDPEIVRKAFRVATLEKPGPTHIELPENVAGHEAGRGRPAAPLAPRPDVLPGADRRGDRPRRRLLNDADRPIVLAGNGVLRRRAPPPAPRLREGPPPAGRGDVHGQGRDRRPLAPVADGRRAPGPRPRPAGLRPGGPRHLRSATTSSSTRRHAGTRTGPSGSSTSTPSRRRSTPATSRRSSSSGTSAARWSGCSPRSCRAASAATTPASATQSRETLVHADLRNVAPRRPDGLRRRRPATRSSRSARCTSCAARSAPRTSSSATSAPTRSGSPASTRPTSRTR